MPQVPHGIAALTSPSSKSFSGLKNTQLHRLAVLIGASCSGTKPTRIQQIEETLLPQIPTAKAGQQTKHLSLLSIDMGIRNLAYAHLTAERTNDRGGGSSILQFANPRLEAWERLSIAPLSTEAANKSRRSTGRPRSHTTPLEDGVPSTKPEAESFEPFQYATYAYNFVNKVIASHQPTHILIERQRFRSGGGSAVQEWTIRVGVFEGMLYAVLRTLAAERGITIATQGILPMKINRYWFEEGPAVEQAAVSPATKLSGKQVKQAKIEIVGSMLSKRLTSDSGFTISRQAETTACEYDLKLNGDPKSGAARPARSLVKLDDLADCLLQGLAWIEWQNNIERVKALGIGAFDLSCR